jgi:DNA-binding PadR family transcriptional regulator
MRHRLRVTATVAKVLAAFLEDPDADRYGLDLMRATGQTSGTLYPILSRLEQAGWVAGRWEDVDPVAASRPARRYYRLTPSGLTSARTEIAALRAYLDRASTGRAPKPRPA